MLLRIPGYDSIVTAAGSRFDPVAATAAIEFFPEYLRHVEGELAGKPFELEAWQKAVLANLFGWKRGDSAGRIVRRYRECLIYVPRKNGKTPLIAGVALLVLFCDAEAGQQDYVAAAEREQAGKLFRQAKGMVEVCPALAEKCRVYGGNAQAGQAKSIVKPDNSFLQVISADASYQHGGTTHLAIIEELHAQPNRDLVDVLTTSMASLNRKSPLTIYVTTADFDRPSICNEIYKRACDVRDNGGNPSKPGCDPAFLPVIYEVKKDEDWRDPAVWARANPNLGVSVSIDHLRRECKKAEETPAYENTFRRLHLNQRTQTDTCAVPMHLWDATAPGPDYDSLLGQMCWAGLDLASVTDLCAFVLLFRVDEGYRVLLYCWAPQEKVLEREKSDRVPYSLWEQQGHLKLTAGNRADYDVIRADIGRLGEQFNIQKIAADPWNATQLLNQLQGDGFSVVEFRQGYKSFTAPTKEMLALVGAGQLFHGGNPLLRWMAANLATEEDAAGNLKPSKSKSRDRIDGMVATIMALGVAMVAGEDDGGGFEAW